MHRTILLTISLLFLITASASAADIFDGYAGMKWGTDLQRIKKEYPRGETGQIHNDLLYKQTRPNREIAQRTFVFREKKLVAVSVKFNADYVRKTGIEKLLARHRKAYGEGTMDRSGAPHMVSYHWEGAKTRLTYAYAPKRPDMTVMLYQQK